MATRAKLTDRQRAVLAKVWSTHAKRLWYRADDHGERVTLASLYYRGLLSRRAWRGVEGERDAAHEYCIAEVVRKRAAEITTDGSGPPKLEDAPLPGDTQGEVTPP